MKLHQLIAVLVLLAVSRCVHAVDIGLIPNSPIAANTNSERWNRAWAASPPKVVTVPLGTVYISDTILTRPVIGCGKVATDAGGGYPVGGHPTLTGARSRVVKIGRGAAFKIYGAGLDMQAQIELVGDGVSSAIEIVGQNEVASGRHDFANITFEKWGVAFDVLGGPTAPQDAHADNCIVHRCQAFNVGTFFRSKNQQAMNWSFTDCLIEALNGPDECTVADIFRGGFTTFDRLVINHPKCTLFKLHEYSPNNCRLVCRNLVRDRFPENIFPGAYFTLVNYCGDPTATYRWSIVIDGFLSQPVDNSKLFIGCTNLQKDGWQIDVEGAK